MGIAITVKDFLESRGVEYEVVDHPHSPSANRAAQAAHVSGDHLAKAVVLEDEGGFLLAVLPASRRLQLGRLHHTLGHHLGLATEAQVTSVFADCAPGAVPALGPAYGLTTLLDDALAAQDDIYFEAGDHESLVHLRGDAFRALLREVRRGDFSAHV